MQNYNIFRVNADDTLEQQYSFRPGLTSLHAVEVATGERLTFHREIVNKDGKFTVYTDLYNRHFVAAVIH